jgi:hypothetical protein
MVTPVAAAVPLLWHSESMLPKASLSDTIGLFAGVVAPTIAKGPIIRRPAMVGLAERLDLDRSAVRQMHPALRNFQEVLREGRNQLRYGGWP